MTGEQIQKRIAELTAKGWWYQDVKIKDASVPLRYPNTASSKFYHAGKWNTFVKSLIPFDISANHTFVEYGSNAGLNLVEAAKCGFSRVVGIEADDNFFAQSELVIGESTFDNIKSSQRYIGKVESNLVASCSAFSFDDIPVADVSLLANFHYWIQTPALEKLIEGLAQKSQYVIIISATDVFNTPTSATIDSVKKLFGNGWTLTDAITQVDSRGDPTPRNLYAMLFKSDSIVKMTAQEIKSKLAIDNRTRYFMDVFALFLKQFQAGQTFHPEFIAYLKQWPIRGRYTNTWADINKEIEYCRRLVKSILNDGFKKPIDFHIDGKKLDVGGWHRLVIADYFNLGELFVKHNYLIN